MQSLRQKMLEGGCTPTQTERFLKKVQLFLRQEGAEIKEQEIGPVETLPVLDELSPDPALLRQTVVLKLNGGLGTSMGLTGPKGLLSVKDGKDFYEISLRQLKAFEERDGFSPPLVFMNSFSTAKATEERLKALGFSQKIPWSFLQSQVPKITESGEPAEVEDKYAWCPPGHGDLYASLVDSGLRVKLLKFGFRYLFVSNIDNLGAVLDSRPAAYMARHGIPFLMEVTRRGEEDRKGGHLARALSDGRLLLREVAQCPKEDLEAFADIDKHRYFNTNNLWVDLEAIKESWTELPLIVNRKPVIPHQEDSATIIQLESAMGAAIGTVKNAAAIEVGRDRFFPVKTTNDLFGVRSDLYRLDESSVLKAVLEKAPLIDLDPKYYKMMEEFESLVEGVPSLVGCRSLTVKGPVLFRETDELVGAVKLENKSRTPQSVSQALVR